MKLRFWGVHTVVVYVHVFCVHIYLTIGMFPHIIFMWISVYIILYTCLSFISQVGNSALMLAAYLGMAKIAVELVKAGANLDLQNKVRCHYVNTY